MPQTISTTPAATAPTVRNRPDEYFAANCWRMVGLGGKNSNTGGCSTSRRAARLNAADSDAVRRKLHAKFIRLVGRDDLHAQAHRLEAQFHFVGERLRQFARAENADALHGVAQLAGNWPSVMRDSRATRSAQQRGPAGRIFNRAFKRAQRRHAAAAGDLQRHRAFADGQREHAVGIIRRRAAATPRGRARS